MKDKGKGNTRPQKADDEFLAGARRAFRRVARRLRIENGRLGLPLITAENGRVRLIRLHGTKR